MSEATNLRNFGGVQIYKSQANGTSHTEWDFGWYDNPGEVAQIVRQQPFASASATPAGQVSSGDLPKEAFLWVLYQKATGKVPPIKNQGQVGSCVAFGTANAIRRTMAVELAINSQVEKLLDIAEEVIYGGSRVEVGGGRIRGDGSIGAWAGQFVKNWGILGRGKYGPNDLTKYSESLCREYGFSGVPDDLEPLAREHPVQEIAAVNTWQEAKRLLASGYGISVCSQQGFSLRRDSRGVAVASGVWAHCMCLDGYIVLESGEEFGHIVNSWGENTHTGPVGWGNPGTDGFWAEKDVVARMLAQGDSWGFSRVKGFPAREINWGDIS